MALEVDIAAFEARLENAIHRTMETYVADTAKSAMQEAIQDVVYNAYPDPAYYERKMKHGGLQDPANMETAYDKSSMTLTLTNVREDEETGKDVAHTVETGQGYDFDFPFRGKPRKFYEVTEKILAKGDFEWALQYGLLEAGFAVKKV